MHKNARDTIIDASVSKSGWRDEWRYDGMMDAGEYDQSCECGHTIRYMFHIVNVITNQQLILGSSCIAEIYTHTDHILHCEQILRGERQMIPYGDYGVMRATGLLSEWELSFLRNVGRKKRLTAKQHRIYIIIIQSYLTKYKGETLK